MGIRFKADDDVSKMVTDLILFGLVEAIRAVGKRFGQAGEPRPETAAAIQAKLEKAELDHIEDVRFHSMIVDMVTAHAAQVNAEAASIVEAIVSGMNAHQYVPNDPDELGDTMPKWFVSLNEHATMFLAKVAVNRMNKPSDAKDFAIRHLDAQNVVAMMTVVRSMYQNFSPTDVHPSKRDEYIATMAERLLDLFMRAIVAVNAADTIRKAINGKNSQEETFKNAYNIDMKVVRQHLAQSLANGRNNEQVRNPDFGGTRH